jgi:hypothetical protein
VPIRFSRFAATASLCALVAAGCAGNSAPSAIPMAQAPAAQAAGNGATLYAYSPVGHALLATYRAGLSGSSSPLSILAGKKTGFFGGKNNLGGGGVRVAADGTVYVLDGMRAKLSVFAPGASGDTAPIRTARLPENSNKALNISQYLGFALDAAGGFWTVDRSNGTMLRFLLSGKGDIAPSETFQPKIASPKGNQEANASTVADDGSGNIYCLCQNHDLLLESYGVTTYAVNAKGKPTLTRSFYGAPGDLHSQFPSDILWVDPVKRQIYLGITGPNFVAAFPTSAFGENSNPRIIGGANTMLGTTPNANIASLVTDAQGALYVAIGSTVLVFDAKARNDVAPSRIISDAKDLNYFGFPGGSLLEIH